MKKNTFQVGDLVDVKPELKQYATEDPGLAVIVNTKHKYEDVKKTKFYTLLWPNGETSIILEKNIQLAE